MRNRLAFIRGILILLLFGSSFAGGSRPRFRFVDVAAQSGLLFRHISGPETDKKYLFEVKGGGVAFLDYDNDGWSDVVFAQGSTLEKFREGGNRKCELYRNLRDGTFQNVTQSARLSAKGWGMGIAAADFDNDGWVDFYITSLGPNTLYRNRGDGTFEDVTDSAGVGDPGWGASAAFADYDGDGDLDLYVANYVDIDLEDLPEPNCRYRGTKTVCGPRNLKGDEDTFYRNQGDGKFIAVSEESGARDVGRRYGLGVVWGDVDQDRDPDLYVANDFGPNYLFVNNGGFFEELGFVSGVALSGDGLEQAGMGVDIADIDNDGLVDIFVTHFASDYSTLYRNSGQLLFEDVTAEAGIQSSEWFLVSWGTHLVDLNHDGWKDIFHANGHVYPFLEDANLSETYRQPPSFYLNLQDGSFRAVTDQMGEIAKQGLVSRGSAVSDYDNDGDLDIVVVNLSGAPSLFRNDLNSDFNWVMFRLRGSESNRDGIGTIINVTTSDTRQVLEVRRNVGIYSSSDPRAHFGLGTAERINSVTVQWPSGKTQRFSDLKANEHYLIDENSGLSLELDASTEEPAPEDRTR